MKANLYINFYIDKQPTRQAELEACLLANVNNPFLDRIIIVLDYKDKEQLIETLEKAEGKKAEKIHHVIKDNRPSYNYYFHLSHQFPDDINIIANTDMVIGRNALEILKKWKWKNHCLALSRWDYLCDNMNEHNTRHHANRDSQDVWMVKGRFKSIPEANFPLGKKGCDNRIAWLLDKHYIVINPSHTIRTFHYHLTGIRNYKPHGTNEDLVHPPYHLIIPSKLP